LPRSRAFVKAARSRDFVAAQWGDVMAVYRRRENGEDGASRDPGKSP
jgi:hypothetical protein